jgi:hypothetical protein
MPALLAPCPELRIELRDGRIFIPPIAAEEAEKRVISHVSVIDQVLGNVLALDKTPDPVPDYKRRY